MPRIACAYAVVALSVATLTLGCSDGTLSRRHAEAVLRDTLGLPAYEKYELVVRGHANLCWYADEFRRAGLATVTESKNWAGCRFNIALTPLGAGFAISAERPGQTWGNDVVVDVRLARVTFGEVTGIMTQGDGTAARVEYTLQRSEVTPFGAIMAKAREGPLSATAVFRKYDDGWRLGNFEPPLSLLPESMAQKHAALGNSPSSGERDSGAIAISPAIPPADAFEDEVEAEPPTAADFAGGDSIVGVAPKAAQPGLNGGQPFFEFQVDKAAGQVSAERPEYPAILRSAGIEGEALVQFVVDTSGRVEVASFKVLKSSHQLLDSAIARVLPTLRFTPAQLKGQKVRQLVQEPFVFTLHKEL